jgi:Zn-dependent membrane protease YugP
MFFFDTNYLVLVLIPSILLTVVAQLYVKSAYSKWSKIRNGAGVTGVQVADQIMRNTTATGVSLEGVPGQLSDHFDPTRNVVRLSQGIATTPSVAAMAVVAHEFGHVQQYREGSLLIHARSFLVPAVQFSPMISYMLILFGVFTRATNLIWLGVLVYAAVVLFSLLTLPVEIDASRRGLRLLRETGLMATQEDANGARTVLTAAALTYVAATLTSLLTLLYYISLASGSSRRR